MYKYLPQQKKGLGILLSVMTLIVKVKVAMKIMMARPKTAKLKVARSRVRPKTATKTMKAGPKTKAYKKLFTKYCPKTQNTAKSIYKSIFHKSNFKVFDHYNH